MQTAHTLHTQPLTSTWLSTSALFAGMTAYLVLALYAAQTPALRHASVVLGVLLATFAGVKFVDWKDTRKFRSLNAAAGVGAVLVFMLALPVQMF